MGISDPKKRACPEWVYSQQYTGVRHSKTSNEHLFAEDAVTYTGSHRVSRQSPAGPAQARLSAVKVCLYRQGFPPFQPHTILIIRQPETLLLTAGSSSAGCGLTKCYVNTYGVVERIT